MKKGITLLALVGASLMFVSCGNSNNSQIEVPTIKVYTRNTTSGTRDGFFTTIGFSTAKEDNEALVKGYIEVSENGDMINAVKNDEYGIGYISLSSLDNSGLKGLSYEGVTPSEANVLNQTYKLTRNFNYITRSDDEASKSGQIVRALIAYMKTKEGKQIIINKSGITKIESTDSSWDEIKANYPIVNQDNSDVTIKIAGSTSVKGITHALLPAFAALCGNFNFTFAETGSGDAYKRTQGSEKDGANKADLAFASREFSSSETYQENTAGKMCTDAIVAVVNKNNSYSSTTASTLSDIYKGTITKWSEVK